MEVQLTAREMFEKLGYKLIVNDIVNLIYSEPDDEDCIYQIRFDKVCGIICKCKIVDGTKMTAEYYLPISFGELKAINKQIEELGVGE